MRAADWIVFCLALAYVVLYGMWRARGHQSVRTFLLAGRRVPWYAVGFGAVLLVIGVLLALPFRRRAYRS